jgi:hypothetical protein
MIFQRIVNFPEIGTVVGVASDIKPLTVWRIHGTFPYFENVLAVSCPISRDCGQIDRFISRSEIRQKLEIDVDVNRVDIGKDLLQCNVAPE